MAKYRAAVAANEKSVTVNDRLAQILVGQGKDREAAVCWRHALDMPLNSAAYREALVSWRRGLQKDPKKTAIGNQLAWLLAASPDAAVRDGQEAVRVAQEMLDLAGKEDPAALDALAAAQAEAGDFAAAIRNAQTAQQLATDRDNAKLAAEIGERLTLYRAGKPYRRAPV